MRANWKRLTACVIALALLPAALGGCGKKEETAQMIAASTTEEKATPTPTPTPKPTPEADYGLLAGVYYTQITMSETSSVTLYLQIEDDGAFVFSRSEDFSDEEKGAGKLGKTAGGKEAFLYTVVNGKKVNTGEREATYELGTDGSIVFTSPMWFGSTEPKFTAEDGTETYPVFLIFDDAARELLAKGEEEKKAEEAKSEEAEATPTPTETSAESGQQEEAGTPEQQAQQQEQIAPVSALTEGTYYGSLEKYIDAMESNVHYDVVLSLSGGSYSYSVTVTLYGNMDYSGTEYYNGGYTVDGTNVWFDGTLSSGSIYGNSIYVTGYLSSFASNQDTVAVFLQ